MLAWCMLKQFCHSKFAKRQTFTVLATEVAAVSCIRAGKVCLVKGQHACHLRPWLCLNPVHLIQCGLHKLGPAAAQGLDKQAKK